MKNFGTLAQETCSWFVELKDHVWTTWEASNFESRNALARRFEAVIILEVEKPLLRTFLGIIGLRAEYQNRQVNLTIMTTAWNRVQVCFSSWMEFIQEDLGSLQQMGECNFAGIAKLDELVGFLAILGKPATFDSYLLIF